jgi:hypothetical protein
MHAEQIRALIFLGSGAVSLAIAAACFFRAKTAMKAALRLGLRREELSYNDTIKMMRSSISFFAWSATTIFLGVLATLRLLDSSQWTALVGL